MRGKGEGAIFKDGRGLWTAVVELSPKDGNRRRKVIRSKKKQVVINRLTEMRAELKRNGDLVTESQTAAEWFTYWLDKVAVDEVRPKTLNNYRSLVKTHILPVIGTKRLDKLTPAHIRRVTEVVAEHLSSSTALSVHRVMSSSFADAEREGRIGRNPAKLVKAPKKAATSLEVLTTAEAAKIVGSFKDSPEAYLWLTFLLTGARRGELLGLEWDRVTTEIDLSWQLQSYKIGEFSAPADYEYRQLTPSLYLTRPKSNAGWRIIPLVEPLRGALNAYRQRVGNNTHGLVFTTADGEAIHPDHATKQWPKVLKVAGIEKGVRLQDLRHTTVDLLTDAGVPDDVIMAIVGHSSRQMTQAYRSRTNRRRLTEGLTQMSSLLGIEQ